MSKIYYRYKGHKKITFTKYIYINRESGENDIE